MRNSYNIIPLDTSDSIIALEGHAPAAAEWIIIGGQRLHDECSHAKRMWKEWEITFEWIAGLTELDVSVKSLCEQALVEMRSIADKQSRIEAL